MSGPIVRSGASPEFSDGWDRIFGKKAKGGQQAGAAPSVSKSSGTKSVGKAAKGAVASVKKTLAKAVSPKKSTKKK